MLDMCKLPQTIDYQKNQHLIRLWLKILDFLIKIELFYSKFLLPGFYFWKNLIFISDSILINDYFDQ